MAEGLHEEELVDMALRALWESPSRGLVVVTEELRVAAVSATFAALVGQPARELVGAPLFDVTPLARGLRDAVARVAAGGDAVRGLELRYDWGDLVVDASPCVLRGRRFAIVEATQSGGGATEGRGGVSDTRRVFTEMSRRLTSVSAAESGAAIQESLAALCQAFDIDRAYVRLLSDDEQRFLLTHEHAREDLERWGAREMSAPALGWAHERFKKGLPVVLTDLDDLPPEAATFRAALAATGVSSTVGVPALAGPRLLGYVAWVHHDRRRWTPTIVERLHLAAEMIASVVARCYAEDELKDRLAFEQSLSQATARFVDLDPPRVDGEILRTLRVVGTNRGLDRAVVMLLDPAGGVLSVAYEWCADGVPSIETTFTARPLEQLSPSTRRALAGETVVAREEDVRPGSDDAELLRRMRVHAFVLVPLAVGGGVRGLLVLQVLRHSRHDGDLATPRARLVADVIAGALSRKASTTRSEGARQRFERIIESAMDAVVALDMDGRVLEWNAQASEVFGQSRDAALRALFTGLIHAEDRALVAARFAALARAGAVHERFELRAAAADGRVTPIELSATQIDSEGGPVIVAFARDISDRKRAESERQRAFDEVSRQKRSAERERDYLREEQVAPSVIGASAAMRAARELVDAVATTDATVLLLGESGSGKEVFARLVHGASKRAGGPFVRVNCASIPSTLFESEFFGHAKGSFTGAHKDRVGRFELADGGTLLLDEVGEIPIDLQAKLLRVLQEGEFERVGEDRTRKLDVRIIAATNRDLAHESAIGRFRSDLYFRLGVFPIRVPPLREREADILLLARHFLARHADRMRRAPFVLSSADEARLLAYDWPGNVRELDHVIERAVILSREGPLRLDVALPGTATHAAEPASAPRGGLLREEDLKRIERENLVSALARANGRVAGPGGAAELLGMRPSTLRDRMKALAIR